MHTQLDTLPVTVNYHLNKNCNFRCKGCYAVFNDDPSTRSVMLPKERMFRIIDAIAGAELPHGVSARKLTFAGGEPTLCPWLPELIAHAKASGLVTMVVTNGSRCTGDYLAAIAPVLDWITISIDSLNPETNRAIGRHNHKGDPLHVADYERVLSTASSLGILTKVNTVVSQLNWRENMNFFIRNSGIARWKILQIMAVEGQNDSHIRSLSIREAEFDAFVARHSAIEDAGIRLVPEPVDSIRGCYCMIDPMGRFFDSAGGGHRYSRPILNVGVATAFSEVSFDNELFIARGGQYDFQSPRTSTAIREEDKRDLVQNMTP